MVNKPACMSGHFEIESCQVIGYISHTEQLITASSFNSHNSVINVH